MASPLPRDIRAKQGTMHARLFENPYAGVPRGLFYSITIPLEPFDSPFSYDEQPLETAFALDHLPLPIDDWRALDGRTFTLTPDQSANATIYLGATHNGVQIPRIHFTRRDAARLYIACTLHCLFEESDLGEDATVEIGADVDFVGLFFERKMVRDPYDQSASISLLQPWVPLDAYVLEPHVDERHVLLSPQATEG